MTTTMPPVADRLSFDKIFHFPDHLRALVERREAYPVHMQISPVNFCNHDCTFCDAARSMFDATGAPRTRIDVPRLLEVVAEMQGFGLRAATLAGSGEPTLHPGIDEMIRGIRRCGVEVGMYTNGSCMTGRLAAAMVECMTFVRFSVTGVTPKVHDLVHAGGDLPRVLKNIERVVAARKGSAPTLGMQFVLASYSADDVVEGARVARELGLDYYAIKPAYVVPGKPDQLPNTLSVEQAEALIAAALEYETETFKVHGKSEQVRKVFVNIDDRRYDDCPGHKTTAILEADLSFYICVNQKIPEFCFGDVRERSFAEVWHGEKRRKALERLDVHQCIPRCRQDPINRIVHEIRIGERTIDVARAESSVDEHVNFI